MDRPTPAGADSLQLGPGSGSAGGFESELESAGEPSAQRFRKRTRVEYVVTTARSDKTPRGAARGRRSGSPPPAARPRFVRSAGTRREKRRSYRRADFPGAP